MNWNEWKDKLLGNRRFWGVAAGILLGVLMLCIGFWRTLLLGICAFLGWWLTGPTNREKIIALVEKLFGKKEN